MTRKDSNGLEWRDIPGFDDYEISRAQDVRRKSTGNLISNYSGNLRMVRGDCKAKGRNSVYGHKNIYKTMMEVWPEVWDES